MVATPRSEDRRHEILGVLFLSLGLFVFISLISYDPQDPSRTSISSHPVVHNLAGKAGAYLSDGLFQVIGGAAYLLGLALGLTGWRYLTGRGSAPNRWTGVGLIGLLLTTSILLDFILPALPSLTDGPVLTGRSGGLFGRLAGAWLSDTFAPLGGGLLVGAAFLLSLLLSTSISISGAAQGVRTGIIRLRSAVAGLIETGRTAWTIYREQNRRWESETRIRRRVPAQRPKIAEAPPPLKSPPKQGDLPFPKAEGDYERPPLALISDPPLSVTRVTREELLANSQILEKKLLDYGIEGRVTQVHPGPVVTMYEFEPAAGVKVQRIVNLSDDLALAMAALRVRIVAPLPGKSVVGIEIPNHHRETVYLKEILTSEVFSDTRSKLTLALGKDISGSPVVADLAGMPHLLVAGATGSGKSVALNGMILSLLFSATPQEVKFIMIDPKLLELSAYDGIPHLQTPVLVRAKDASRVFQRLVAEMQNRYRLLAEAGVRNIEGYNRKMREGSGGPPAEATVGTPLSHLSPAGLPLPYLVVIVDELADLMMVAARDVEDSITRLAQMARAAGIHLVVATQRPSVDVLTGLIKANFPARISFQVSSKTDSRTILDANGAEQLLGRGDMLFLAPGTGRITRIHGALITENEIRAVVDHVKAQAKPHYLELTGETNLAEEVEENPDGVERDELYDKAVDVVVGSQTASASLIQRRLRVGYPRAARMIEMMEEDGVVGPATGGKPREVLNRKEEPTA